jgi:hypothetical protein
MMIVSRFDLLDIGFTPSAAMPAEIVHHQINSLIVRRHDRRRPATHDATPRTTREGAELTPSSEWEVVYVFENGMSAQDTEYLRVLVTGVEQSESVENFRWGAGPLTPSQ